MNWSILLIESIESRKVPRSWRGKYGYRRMRRRCAVDGQAGLLMNLSSCMR